MKGTKERKKERKKRKKKERKKERKKKERKKKVRKIWLMHLRGKTLHHATGLNRRYAF